MIERKQATIWDQHFEEAFNRPGDPANLPPADGIVGNDTSPPTQRSH